jgi:hypothetical protein
MVQLYFMSRMTGKYSNKLKSWGTEDWIVIKWVPGSNWIVDEEAL